MNIKMIHLILILFKKCLTITLIIKILKFKWIEIKRFKKSNWIFKNLLIKIQIKVK